VAGELSAALETASGNGWTVAFKRVSDGCKACHKSYRLEKESR
jgi:cytochrome c556